MVLFYLQGKSLCDAIKSEFSGDIKNGLLAVVQSIENRPQFFAKCLHDSMAGMGTRVREENQGGVAVRRETLRLSSSVLM